MEHLPIPSVSTKTVAVALSGGVDSAVAAWLLQKHGYSVFGLFMWHGFGNQQTERTDAQQIAEQLNFPLKIVDVSGPFQTIVDGFVQHYLDGKTPNPCVLCNRTLKFGVLLDAARASGARQLATGHYARIHCISKQDDTLAIFRGRDVARDQSYVLFGIERCHLSRLLFPTGDFTKSEIRTMAAAIGLQVAQKKDSQDVCFVPNHTHGDFIRSHRLYSTIGDTAGPFVSTDGKVIGHHDGYERFTIGQRKGMKVGFGQRMYVTDICAARRTVSLGVESDLLRTSLTATNSNWHVPVTVGETFACEVKIRYRSPSRRALVTPSDSTSFEVQFMEPVSGVAPGQFAVCYRGSQLLGGGEITR